MTDWFALAKSICADPWLERERIEVPLPTKCPYCGLMSVIDGQCTECEAKEM